MTNTKSWGIWFLVIFFLWAVGKDFQLIVTFTRSTDYFIFDFHGLLNLFFALMTLTFLVDFSASYYIFRPSRVGFWVCIASVIIGLIYNLIALLLALDNLPGVKEAYRIGREVRGFPVRDAGLDHIFSPEGIQAGVAMTTLFSVTTLILLIFNRNYFETSDNDHDV